MFKSLVILIVSFISLQVCAQTTTTNKDLRVNKEVFSIKEVGHKGKKLTYKLETSRSGQYNISMAKGVKLLKTRKLDSKTAQTLDDEFVDRFISFKYIMKARMKANCENSFKLSLRGEGLVICSDEEEKIKLIKTFIDKLKKHHT